VLTVGILIAGYGHTAIHTEQAAHMLHGVCMCIRAYVRRFRMHHLR
jgi:hypothetical protein